MTGKRSRDLRNVGLDEALAHFEAALRLRPDLPGARENVARLRNAAQDRPR